MGKARVPHCAMSPPLSQPFLCDLAEAMMRVTPPDGRHDGAPSTTVKAARVPALVQVFCEKLTCVPCWDAQHFH